jgi:DNA-binding GntR family transcriptional regulator
MPFKKNTFKNPSISKTLSQTIYNYLKEAIVSNQLKANQRIIEKDIAEMFGVSTTPVREAALRLAAEGYLFVDSHRKTVVKENSYQELINILQVLTDLDSMAINYAVDCLQPEHLQKLGELTEQMEQAGQSKEIEKYLEINTSIHRTIWDVLPNPVLKKTIESVHGQLMRYNYSRITAYRDPEILKRSIEGHKKILRALEDKDRRALKSLIKSNWNLLDDKKSQKSGERGAKLKGGDAHTKKNIGTRRKINQIQ